MDESLFLKYFKGATTAEEEKSILQWIESSDDNRKEFYDLKAIWNAVQNDPERKAAAAPGKMSWSHKHRASRWMVWVSSAAACLLAGLVLFFALRPSVPENLITYVNPSKEVLEVKLPDNSSVFLKPDSRVTCPEEFRKKSRSVTLDGEAFFDVVHDSESPFTVSTPFFKVRVLGTSFNVMATKGANFASVMLQSGSVKIFQNDGSESVTLVPDEEAVYSTSTGGFQVVKANASYYALVNYSLVTMNNVTLSEIINKINVMYGVHLSADMADDNRHFNFNFLKSSSIDDLIKILEILTGDKITY
ncbi:MAG: FecR domain-containing protein [Bacteroidales bacterium]|jgi:ferric-dicitrate binding protein FerR (iron transport regulator)|nr:FecR domain-containing protein [Bacteroidales bacterium]MCI2146291.1 FecR domain-containing protein [Bacteroidales bacterium]